jgi:hypothetical protein
VSSKTEMIQIVLLFEKLNVSHVKVHNLVKHVHGYISEKLNTLYVFVHNLVEIVIDLKDIESITIFWL